MKSSVTLVYLSVTMAMVSPIFALPNTRPIAEMMKRDPTPEFPDSECGVAVESYLDGDLEKRDSNVPLPGPPEFWCCDVSPPSIP